MFPIIDARSHNAGIQPTNWAEALRAARFFLGIYIHVFCAGLLVIFALADLFQVSPYIKTPGAILALVLSAIGLYKSIRSQHIFARILIELAVILATSVFVCLYLWDYSYDGVHYHLPATIALAEGWNPFFEATKSTWADHYPHGIWTLRAAFDVAVWGFDLGRVFNVLFCFSSYWSLQYWIAGAVGGRLTVLDRALIVLAAFNPVVVGELLTNLVDGVLCSLSLSLLCYLMLGQKETGKWTLLGAVATCVLLINTKIAGLAFAFLITSSALLVQWIYAGLSFRWLKLQSPWVLALAMGGLASVVLVGYRPYVTNLVDHGTVVYPPSDVILKDWMPSNLRGADHLTKLAHVLFAQTGALNAGDMSILKWPVQIRTSEFAASSGVSSSGGFGPFFALFWLSTMACVTYSFISRPSSGQLRHEFLIASGILMFSCIIFPEPWFARYIPMLPASFILLLFAVRERVTWYLLSIPVVILILNTAPFIAKAGWSGYLQTKNVKDTLDVIGQLTPQSQVKISQVEPSVDWSLYVKYLLSRHGLNVTYSVCGPIDKRLVHFSPLELCVSQ